MPIEYKQYSASIAAAKSPIGSSVLKDNASRQTSIGMLTAAATIGAAVSNLVSRAAKRNFQFL